MPPPAKPHPAAALPPPYRARLRAWRADWRLFAREALGVRLDPDQEAILASVQHHPRTVVKSGHARGKDFVAAVASLCFLYLNYPSKVISTAPTDRQVRAIMMTEAKAIWQRAKIPLGGRFNTEGIKFDEDPDWFLLGFKAGDKATEDWTGFHSENILVVVTEASGVSQETFDAIKGLLTGNSRLLLVLNPNRTSGEAYNAFRNPQYTKFTLNCLNAPNVVSRRNDIPGQVDWAWVNSMIQEPGWVHRIPAESAVPEQGDFAWDHRDGRGPVWYRPMDLARVKILGLWPNEPEGQLIPMAWVEAAQERWRQWQAEGGALPAGEALRLGADVAGMGADLSVLCYRYGPAVVRFEAHGRSDHMATAGRIKAALEGAASAAAGNGAGRNGHARNGNGRHAAPVEAAAFVDTIGEGAGVHSRLVEQGVRSVSVKFSEGALGLADLTGQRRFRNLRAYCWWAIRDALDPQLVPAGGGGLMLPPGDEIVRDLTAPRWETDSQGRIFLEDKDAIKARIGCSPDYGDALANTFYPRGFGPAAVAGVFEGVGVF
jgi:hypothetical protein